MSGMDYRSFHLAAVHELVGSGAGWKAVLWGELSEMAVPDIFNILSQSRRTGLLLVRGADGTERALGLLDGDVVWSASSEAPEHDPREVTFSLVRLRSGQFIFLRGAVPAGERSSAQELLLTGLCRLDEEHRLAS